MRRVAATVLVALGLAGLGYGYATLISQGKEIRNLESRLITTTKASAETRITTVSQRCDLTSENRTGAQLEQIEALLVRNVIDKFIPKIRSPFDALAAAYNQQVASYSAKYAACEKQLKTVKQIAKHAVGP